VSDEKRPGMGGERVREKKVKGPIAGCNDVAPGSLAQSKAGLTVFSLFLRSFSYQASPYTIDDGWCNITARRCKVRAIGAF